jgi:hypothetical protein
VSSHTETEANSSQGVGDPEPTYKIRSLAMLPMPPRYEIPENANSSKLDIKHKISQVNEQSETKDVVQFVKLHKKPVGRPRKSEPSLCHLCNKDYKKPGMLAQHLKWGNGKCYELTNLVKVGGWFDC